VYYESEGRKTAPGEEGCLDHGRLPKMTDEASAKRGRKTDRLTPIALGLTAGVYLWLAFSYLPAGTYWSPDNGLKRIQAENIRFTPWLDLSIDYPGQWLDPRFEFAPFAPLFYFVSQGRLYFVQTPTIAILGKPFIWLMGEQGERVVPVLAGLISLSLVASLMQRLGFCPAWAGVLLAGFATPLLGYSLLFWEHTLAVALGLGAVGCVFRAPESASLRNFFFAGTLAGLAAGIRKDMLLFALVLGVMLGLSLVEGFTTPAGPADARNFQTEQRRWAWQGLSWLGGAFVAVFMLYALNRPQAGRVLPPEIALAADDAPQSYIAVHGWESFADFIFAPGHGLAGGALVVALGVYWLARRVSHAPAQEAIQIAALAVMGAGVGSFVPGYWRSGVLHGFLSASPCLALSLAGPVSDNRRAKWLARLTLSFLLVYMLGVGLLTSRGPFRGGIEWGARYMLIVFPLSAPFAVNGLRHIWGRAARSWLARAHFLLALALVGLSVFIQALGIGLIRDSVKLRQGSQAALLGLPEKVIVTDVGWIALRVPEVYAAKTLFMLASPSDLPVWVALAQASQVRGLAFVSHTPLDEAAAASLAPDGARVSIVETRRLDAGVFVTRLAILPTP